MVVAEELNFRTAAKRVGLSQPSLSRSIRLLERALGVKLFERRARGVSLTRAGRTLLDECPRLIEHVSLVEHVTVRSSQAARLNVGFLPPALYGYFPEALEHFRTRWPGIELKLEELASAEQYTRVQDGTLDVGFVNLEVDHPRQIAVRIIDRSRVVLAVPSKWPLARKKAISLSELKDIPLIAAARSANMAARDRLELAWRTAGFVPKIVHDANQAYPILRLVATGLGVGFVPERAEIHKVMGVKLIPVQDPSFRAEVVLGMIWLDRKLPAYVKNFIRCVIDSVPASNAAGRRHVETEPSRV